MADLIGSAKAGNGVHDVSVGGAQLLGYSSGIAEPYVASTNAYGAEAVDQWSD